jgi:RecJ-like exonuclease
MKHDCPTCQCKGDMPTYPVECPVCHVLYGPGHYPDNHPAHCDGSSTEILKKSGAKFANAGAMPRAAG